MSKYILSFLVALLIANLLFLLNTRNDLNETICGIESLIRNAYFLGQQDALLGEVHIENKSGKWEWKNEIWKNKRKQKTIMGESK